MDLTKHWAGTLDDYTIDLAWAPDGRLLAGASAAGPVTVFGTADGAVKQRLDAHAAGTNCIAYGPHLATGGQDGCVKLWDAAQGQHVATAALGKAWVDHLAWRPGAPQLAAAAGRTLTFVGAEGQVLKAAADAPKTITALAWHPSGGSVAAAAFGGVRLWDSDDFLLQKEMAYNNGIHALAWSPDGEWLVSGNQDPSVHLWKPETDLELHMSGYESKVKHLSFDRSGRWLATSGGRDACIWDCAGANGPEGREPVMLPHEAPVSAVAFQHAHGLLATAAQDGSAMLWSPDRASPLRATVRLPAPPTKLVWSPDDSLLAIGTEKGIIYVLRCS